MPAALLVLSLLSCGLAPAAHAQEPSRPLVIVVTLRNGTVLQGELVEKVPGDHVTLRMATGEIRTIPASEMATPPAAPPPTAPPPASAVPAAPLPTSAFPAAPLDDSIYREADAVRVHIESNKPWSTYLYQAAPGGPSVGWNRLCLAPCDRPVDPKGTYRIGGQRIVDSDSFQLGSAPRQTLYVDATTAGVPAMAWISTILGAALTVPALYLISRPAKPPSDPGPDTNHLPGYILLANGAPWLITGLILFAVGGTTVKSDRGERLAWKPQVRSVSLGGPFRLTSSGITF